MGKIKSWFMSGYNPLAKFGIFILAAIILSIILGKITDGIGLTDYSAYREARGLWIAFGAPTLKSSYDMFFENVPDTHDTVSSIASWATVLFSFLTLYILNKKKVDNS